MKTKQHFRLNKLPEKTSLDRRKVTGVGRLLSAVLVAGLMASSAQAGVITSVPAPATGADGFGGWNLGNVEVEVNGTGSTFNEVTGGYFFDPADTDYTYFGAVYDAIFAEGVLPIGNLMGHVLAKDWPVGEPSGIKVINGDTLVKFPKPENCIMATSYLADHFLDSVDPQQVICSSGFQSHKRYKLAMLPSTVAGGTGLEKGVDLVFNVEADGGSRDYQVFQKINNWTDGRLEGFTIQVGFGIGANFKSTTDEGVDIADLHLTVPSDIWSATQLANFSEGLFGPFDDHTETLGFFDPNQRAGFLIQEYLADPLTSEPTDTLHSDGTLGSDYAQVPPHTGPLSQFGPWLSNSMLPQGIFFDDDGNPETDAQLLAWYGWDPLKSVDGGAPGALGWMSGSQGSDESPVAFSAISDGKIAEMGANLSFTMGEIDDLVNVGLNYVVTVGDVSAFPGTTFTIRITPQVDTSGIGDPAYVGAVPDPLLLFTSSDAEVLLEPAVEFVIGSLLTARVGDADLNIDTSVAETVDVLISKDDFVSSESLTLIEQGLNRGVFAATLPDEFSNVQAGTVVSMRYTDADIGNTTSEIKESSTMAIEEPLPILSDVTITSFSVPVRVFDGSSRTLRLSIVNDRKAQEAATGTVLVTGSDGSEFEGEFTDLAVGKKLKFSWSWSASRADLGDAETVEWTASVTVNDQMVDYVEDKVTYVAEKKGNNK